MGNTLRQLRVGKGWTQQQAADALGLSKSGYIKWEHEQRGLNSDKIRRVAKAYGVEPSQVMDSPLKVEIVGRIGPDSVGSVVFSSADEELGWAPLPPDSGDHVAALLVLGESMIGVAEDGYLIYFENVCRPIEEAMIGELCVVWLEDGQVIVRRPYHSRAPGRFDLERSGSVTLREQQVRGAAYVTWIAPRRTARQGS